MLALETESIPAQIHSTKHTTRETLSSGKYAYHNEVKDYSNICKSTALRPNVTGVGMSMCSCAYFISEKIKIKKNNCGILVLMVAQ